MSSEIVSESMAVFFLLNFNRKVNANLALSNRPVQLASLLFYILLDSIDFWMLYERSLQHVCSISNIHNGQAEKMLDRGGNRIYNL